MVGYDLKKQAITERDSSGVANDIQNHPPATASAVVLYTKLRDFASDPPRRNPCPFLAGLWRDFHGRGPEVDDRPAPSLESLSASEWCDEFEARMRNRLILGALRHGVIGGAGKPRYDRVASARRRLRRYLETGNREHLVDVANMMLLEYVEGEHPRKHWAPGDDTEHTPVVSE